MLLNPYQYQFLGIMIVSLLFSWNSIYISSSLVIVDYIVGKKSFF
ncbi:hypothetical protein ['Camptotheca acuminata' phytoplasma]